MFRPAAAMTLGCCIVVLGVAAAPASSHTLSSKAVQVLADEDADDSGSSATCKRISRHRIDCDIPWISADSGGSDRVRYELRGQRLFDGPAGAKLTEFSVERYPVVVGSARAMSGPHFSLEVEYRTRHGEFYAARILSGKGNLRMTCATGETRLVGTISWPAVPMSRNGVFGHRRRNGSEMRGRATGHRLSGWLRHSEGDCATGRLTFSGRATDLPRFIT